MKRIAGSWSGSVWQLVLVGGMWLLLLSANQGADGGAKSALDEFKIKRQEVFEFSQKPIIAQNGDAVTISFASKGFCDVTVAIENSEGLIIRHLASGVLGGNAPAPFVRDSLQQSIVWDGKDDQGKYVDDRSGLHVRVSLGLQAQFERPLFWSPKKRVTRGNRPLLAATEQGMFVFEGEGVDHVRHFDHQGEYVRTVYPFPANKLGSVQGLEWATFPQDGQKLPLKHGIVQATLLDSGRNIYPSGWSKYECAASAFAAHQGQLALAMDRLNRLSADGASGGLNLSGPATSLTLEYQHLKPEQVAPRSAAFSPDGKWLYLTGYLYRPQWPHPPEWLPVVTRLDFAGTGATEIFVGQARFQKKDADKDDFQVPASVACDAQGRVYVADHMRDRIQVYEPDGKFRQSITVPRPTVVQVHPRTGEIYVFSWFLMNRFINNETHVPATFTRLGPLDDPRPRTVCPLPLNNYTGKPGLRVYGFEYNVTVDTWTEPPTFWLVPGAIGSVEKLLFVRGQMDKSAAEGCLRLLVEEGGKLVVKRNFGPEVVAAVVQPQPPIHSRQKLYVNPRTGKLYVFEGQAGASKSCKDLLEIDPTTGEIRVVPLPFDAEDLAFDIHGLAYLRTDNIVGRFDSATWREVPFDYGEERQSVGFSASSDGRRKNLIGALSTPGTRPGCFHQGGMHVSLKGNLLLPCYNVNHADDRREEGETLQALKTTAGRPYTPQMFPGRLRYNEVHLWDKHGQLLHDDAFPGVTMMDGVAIDKDDNLYLMIAPNRVLDGEPYFLERAETLVKVRPKQAQLVSGKRDLPVPLTQKPARPADLMRGSSSKWLEGQEWLYGGVGFGGFNSSKGGGGCACWHARFALDYFARSFAPEVDHFSVAVLDTNGNLILRIGQYGNADSTGPNSLVPLDGDGVGLFHAAYLAADTDHRLFISDGGNARIVSVKLNYHASENVPLRGSAN